jgi:hypothetical protein
MVPVNAMETCIRVLCVVSDWELCVLDVGLQLVLSYVGGSDSAYMRVSVLLHVVPVVRDGLSGDLCYYCSYHSDARAEQRT